MFKLLAGCFFYLVFSANPYSSISDLKRLPGTVSIGHNICMRQTEVTVHEWIDFIVNNDFDSSLYPANACLSNSWTRLIFEDLKNKGNFKHLIVSRIPAHQSLLSFRLKRDALSDSLKKTEFVPLSLPITGITFDQAVKFCKWKEQLFNMDRDDSKKVQVGLPSIEIYKLVIENIDSISIHSANPCTQFKFNYRHSYCQNKYLQNSLQGQTILRVDSYGPTHLNLYCIQGNAAEMTASKGVAMGGSFRHYANQSVSSAVQSYSGTENWLGFRYVVTLRTAPAID